MTVLIAQADLTNVADAWQVGVPNVVGTISAERTDPAILDQPQAETPPVFHELPAGSGWKLALGRLFRLGGNMGTPTGPPPGGHRLRRRIPTPVGAATVERTVTRMPAGLVPTGPVYEDYLTGQLA